MKITSLQIADYKRIHAVSLIPDGNTVLLTGDNGQGKSSVLDAIVEAIQGSVAEHPIRTGADSTTITLSIAGEAQTYTVRRRITPAGSYLDITTADGLKVPKAATFLAGLVGQLSFDPEQFARLKPVDQAEQLRRTVGLDTTAIDAKIAALFATRRDANRDAKQAVAALDALPKPVSLELMPEKSVAEMAEEGRKLTAEADEMQARAAEVDRAYKQVSLTSADVTRLKDLLAKAEANLENDVRIHAELNDKWRADNCVERNTKARERLETLRAEYKTVDTTNRQARAHNASVEAFTKAKARADELGDASAELDAQLIKAQEARQKAIKAANFPIEGLSITEAGVTLNGIPFADLNTAERIKVSTLIAMAANPKLRVIFVREGALINRANLKIITDLASDRGYQVWIEKFQEEAGAEGIHIVDGGVALIDGKPTA